MGTRWRARVGGSTFLRARYWARAGGRILLGAHLWARVGGRMLKFMSWRVRTSKRDFIFMERA